MYVQGVPTFHGFSNNGNGLTENCEYAFRFHVDHLCSGGCSKLKHFAIMPPND